MKVLNTATVLERARIKHGDKYLYDKFVYVNKRTRCTITCPVHGDFDQYPLQHVKEGYGCPPCANEYKASSRTWTTAQFVTRAKEVHGDRYDYTDSTYDGGRNYITIKCTVHGDFKQNAHSHLCGHGCPQCGWLLGGLKGRLTQQQFLTACKQQHGEKYDYSATVYIKSDEPVVIDCRIHGSFLQTPYHHIQGSGCRKCVDAATQERSKLTTQQYVTACLAKRGDKYDYSNVQYVGMKSDIVITCPKHGDFLQNAGNHYHNLADCPRCSSGRFSKIAIEWLEYRSQQDGVYIQHAINGREVRIKLPSGKHISFDGYSQETNTVYEFFGDYYHGNPQVYDAEMTNAVSKRKMGDLWEETCQRIDTILSLGYNLVTIWENDWMKLRKARFFDN